MKKFSALLLALLMVTTVAVTPLEAKTKPVVRKAIAVQQTTAKVVAAGTDGTQSAVVVLPPGFENHEVVVADSTEYKQMLADNKALRDQVAAEKGWEAKYIKETEQVQKDQAAALVNEQKKTSSIFSAFGWIKWVAGGGLVTFIVAAIVICIFFPPMIPVIEEWIVSLVKAIIRIFKDFAEVAESVFASFKKKPTPPTP